MGSPIFPSKFTCNFVHYKKSSTVYHFLWIKLIDVTGQPIPFVRKVVDKKPTSISVLPTASLHDVASDNLVYFPMGLGKFNRHLSYWFTFDSWRVKGSCN